MSQVPEISGQAADPNFRAPDSFTHQSFRESPSQVEQPPHIPTGVIDGYYPAINGIDPDRRALVIGAEEARFTESKTSQDAPQLTEENSTNHGKPGEQIELGLISDGETEARRVQLLAEMTVYVAYAPWFPPAEPVEGSVDFRKSARHGRLRLHNSRVRR